MIYPANFEYKSGFAVIRDLLHQHCLMEYSHGLVEEIKFTSDFSTIRVQLNQTAEMKYLLQFISGFPQQDYYDLTSELVRIRIKGTYLESESLSELKLSLEAITAIITFINNLDESNFKELRSLVPAQIPDRAIIETIRKIIDDKGEIRDNASEKLLGIRKEIKSLSSSIDKRINQIVNQARKDNVINDDTELTIRNGRLVIPVPAGNKRRIRGYVHDTSATGQTVYLEPAEVFDINNDIQNLRVEEKQEIIHILINFTDYLRASLDELLDYYKFLGEIDFIKAKALLSIEFNAVLPVLSDQPLINWRKAVHPLLAKSLSKQGKSIVSQEVLINSEQRIMIISGPNAGGKSVCLKTLALLQYMLQCGLLIPVSEDSTAGLFSKIFMEIGDEQSMENDLSTYSSHLIHIKHFLENADSKTLFFIDEFGAGTEPQLGGAMAEASLEKLNKIESFGVVTTHYTNLKLMADNNYGIFNAAMLYDTEAMKPLFKLKTGKPGSSFAFEIANNIGFPLEVVTNAGSKIGTNQLDFEKQLAQLEVDKKNIEQKKLELKIADETLDEVLQRYKKLLSDLEARKNLVIKDAKNKAQQLINDSNKLIENTIREIKESQAEKVNTKRLRQELNKSLKVLVSESNTNAQAETESVNEELQTLNTQDSQTSKSGLSTNFHLTKGTYVKMEGQDSIGIVEEVKANRALVAFGSFKFRTSINNLTLASESEVRFYESSQHLSGRSLSVINDLNAKMADFKMSIDIRGKKPEEAKEAISRYIDQAILLRVHEVRILHGKGNGVLRNTVHSYLNETPEVIKIEDEKLERGGHGITLVYLQ